MPPASKRSIWAGMLTTAPPPVPLTSIAFAPRGYQSFRMSIPLWLREKLFLKDLLLKELKALDASVDWRSKLLFSEHHLSHAASAFYPSPFDEAAVLTLDGVGEWATTTWGAGRGPRARSGTGSGGPWTPWAAAPRGEVVGAGPRASAQEGRRPNDRGTPLGCSSACRKW